MLTAPGKPTRHAFRQHETTLILKRYHPVRPNSLYNFCLKNFTNFKHKGGEGRIFFTSAHFVKSLTWVAVPKTHYGNRNSEYPQRLFSNISFWTDAISEQSEPDNHHPPHPTPMLPERQAKGYVTRAHVTHCSVSNVKARQTALWRKPVHSIRTFAGLLPCMGYICCDNHMPTNSHRIQFYYLHTGCW